MKIFNIGMPKTGTLSFARAMEILGHESIHHPDEATRMKAFDGSLGPTVLSNFGEWDYEQLFVANPDARFVRTYRRDTAAWCRSVYGMMERQKEGGWEGAWWNTYGTPVYDEKLVRNANHMHGLLVESWAKKYKINYHRQGVMDGWERLCSWLDVPVPGCDYPWEHKGGE